MLTDSVDGSPSSGVSFEAVLVGGAVAAGSVGEALIDIVVEEISPLVDEELLEQAPRTNSKEVVIAAEYLKEVELRTFLSCHR